MARARNIKPGFFKNADLVELTMEARLLFIGLWTMADRAGRLEDRPKQIKMEIFPADSVDVNACLDALQIAGFVARYVIDGKRLIQVVNFSKHQNPHRAEKASELPSQDGLIDAKPVEPDASTVQAPCNDDADTVPAGLIPDPRFLNPDSLLQCTHTPLAPEWVLPKPWGEWAIAEYPHWTPDTVRLIASKFANHWLASGGASADWSATWRKWCQDKLTQDAHKPARDSPSAGPKLATADSDAAAKTAAALAQREGHVSTPEAKAAAEAARLAVMSKRLKPKTEDAAA